MAFKDTQAAPRPHVPQPHGLIIGAREGTLSIWIERVGLDISLGVEMNGHL
jgi:hypothetical protein